MFLARFVRFFLSGITRKQLLIGFGKNKTTGAVDDDLFAIVQKAARAVHADNRGNTQAARKNGGMRCRSAQLGNKADDVLTLQKYRIGGRQIVGDNDAVFGIHFLIVNLRGRLMQEALNQLYDMRDVVAACFEIVVLHAVEYRNNIFIVKRQSPFGIAQLGCNGFGDIVE